MGVVMAPTIQDLTGDAPREWQYDEYRPLSDYGGDGTSVSGAFETVTIGGTAYVHAKGVGTGKIGPESYTVGKAVLDVVFMWGQSNAAYRNPDTETATYPGLGVGYFYGYEDQSGPLANENNTGFDLTRTGFWSMVDEEGNLRIGDKPPAFTAEYHDLSGHRVYWVNAAIGNKAISTFLGPDGMLYTYAKELIPKAIAAVDSNLFELRPGCWLWAQGEADASGTVSTYQARLKTVAYEVRTGELGGGDLFSFDKVYIIKTRDVNGGNAAIAQIELCEQYSRFVMATVASDTFTLENGLIGSDNLHYSQLGNNIIGYEAAKTVVETEGIEKTKVPLADALGTIPILVIGALLLSAVGFVILRNRD